LRGDVHALVIAAAVIAVAAAGGLVVTVMMRRTAHYGCSYLTLGCDVRFGLWRLVVVVALSLFFPIYPTPATTPTHLTISLPTFALIALHLSVAGAFSYEFH